ncbi:MAG: O-antigen ligase family protein, partial [Candidatus Binatia bacterium]
GRTDTGALLGNEGHLAQLTALALVVVVAVSIVMPVAGVRGLLVVVGAVFAAALVSNRNLTALVALTCGVGIALVLARGRKALVSIGLVVLVLGATVVVVAPLRGRVVQAVQAASQGDWDAVTTYRLGPWAAALEMVRERPLTGFGPGTFGAEFTAHRLDAELRHERRFTIPVLTSSFGEAHSEYLQAVAEAGMPAALAVVVALGALLAGLVRLTLDPHETRRDEAVVLVAFLGAGAVASLMWFPLQRPITALPLVLAAGRGWALLRPRVAAEAGRVAVNGGRRVLAILTVLVLGAALVPELSRYAAERRLADATQAIAAVAAGGRVVPAEAPTLDRLGAVARATADANPSDTRGLIAAGTAALVAGKPGAAQTWYRAALARGERPEIDLNLARAFALDGRREQAEAALLRAAWLSPVLLGTLPSADQSRIGTAVADWADRLARGALTAPPPLPAETPPTAE